MSSITFHPTQVNGSITGLNHTIQKLSSIRQDVSSLEHRIDSKILNRRGLRERLASSTRSLQAFEQDLNRIKSFINTSSEKYQTAESKLNEKSKEFESDMKGLMEKLLPSNLYDLYQDTFGVIEGFLTASMYSGSAFLLHFLGLRFEKMNNGLFRYITKDLDYKKFSLPAGKIFDVIENNKLLKTAARFLLGPSAYLLHRDKSISELVYKKMTGLLPSVTIGVTNDIQTMIRGFVNKGIGGVFEVIKGNAWSMVKNGLKFAKANAILAGGITLLTEGIGATIKITENYALYGNDIEKLKTENAKAVGEAVYNTAVITGTSTAGAVIGGIAGSFAGPLGTVIGASVGGFIGSLIGDAITKKTPEAVTDKAVQHKELIHKGTEFIGHAVNITKDGFNAVKENVSSLVQNAGNFFSKIGFNT